MAPRADKALLQRLETLTGEDGACCTVDLRGEADALRARARARLPFLKALSEENRLTAAALLKAKGEMCACEVQAALGLTHATVSHHMGALVAAGVVVGEKRGKWMHYRLAEAARAWVP